MLTHKFLTTMFGCLGTIETTNPRTWRLTAEGESYLNMKLTVYLSSNEVVINGRFLKPARKLGLPDLRQQRFRQILHELLRQIALIDPFLLGSEQVQVHHQAPRRRSRL